MIRNSTRFWMAAVMGALSAAPAMADTPAPPTQKTQRTQDPNEVICQRQEVVGSRLQTRRVCRTRAEWADLQLQDRQEIERVQVQRGSIGE